MTYTIEEIKTWLPYESADDGQWSGAARYLLAEMEARDKEIERLLKENENMSAEMAKSVNGRMGLEEVVESRLVEILDFMGATRT